ncbi:MAG: hypothetical protein AABO58_01340 [Acidobacteriota bacterium]
MRRAAYLVFILLFPAVVLIAYALHIVFPGVSGIVFFGGAFFVLAAVWGVVAVAGRNGKGNDFPAELEVVAVKLREQAAEIENHKFEVSAALQESLAELRVKAKTFDHHQIVVGFDLAVPDAGEFREAAAELDEYAADVRSRGGIHWR